MKEKEFYTIEYSASQKCFHIDTLSNVLKINRMNCVSQNSNDYQIIDICGSFEEAERALKKFRSENHSRYFTEQRQSGTGSKMRIYSSIKKHIGQLDIDSAAYERLIRSVAEVLGI